MSEDYICEAAGIRILYVLPSGSTGQQRVQGSVVPSGYDYLKGMITLVSMERVACEPYAECHIAIPSCPAAPLGLPYIHMQYGSV